MAEPITKLRPAKRRRKVHSRVRDPIKKAENAAKMVEMTQTIPDYKELGLSVAELRFVCHYILTENGTEAMLAAYPKMTRKNAGIRAVEWKRKANIVEAIANYKRRWSNDIRDKYRNDIIKILAARAFFDPKDVINAGGGLKGAGIWDTGADLEALSWESRMCIEGIERKASGALVMSKVTLCDRDKAIAALSDKLDLFAKAKDDKTELTPDTEEQLNRIFREG